MEILERLCFVAGAVVFFTFWCPFLVYACVSMGVLAYHNAQARLMMTGKVYLPNDLKLGVKR